MNRQRRFFLFFVMTAFVGLLTMHVSMRAQAATSVFINEIHYDNDGTDVGEAIEIAGPAGTDLSSWSLVLYNGNGGAVYDTDAIGATIPDLGGGFGVVVVSYPSNGIQNGSPDGFALVDNTGAVIQFLSYEGSFAAVGGPADGMVSTDIGVSEPSDTAVGHSLQLTGTGSAYEDFTWVPAGPNTFGAFNTNQSFTGGPGEPSDPVINEFVFNHTGTDTYEFVEIAGDNNTEYSNLSLVQIEGDSTGAGVIDGVFLLGTTNANGYWTTGFLGNAFENGTVTVLLVEGFTGAISDDLDLDNDGTLDATPWTRIVDSIAVNDGGTGDLTYGETTLAASFDGGSFTVGGASRIPDRIDTNNSSDWVRNDFDGSGLPGFTNMPDPGEAINTPEAANEIAPPLVPSLVVNEIDYDQPGTDTAEFVELKNIGETAVNLDGIVLELINGNGTVVYGSYALPAVSLSAGEYYVVCSSIASVANCDLDVTPDTNLIQNGSPDAVAITYNGELIDTVSYEGDTGSPYTEGSGTGLEDSADGSISRCPDGIDTNQNNADFVFTSSTPGAANDCNGGEVQEAKIHEIQGAGSSVAITNLVQVEAVVVGDYQNSDQLNGFFIQEEDNDIDADPNTSEGIFVYCNPCAAEVNVGDLVEVTGLPEDFFGMSQIDVTGSNGVVNVLSSSNPLPQPTMVDLPAGGSTLAETTFENVEGMLVYFTDTLVVSEYFELARYGQLVLTADARPRQFTDANEPSISGYTAFLEDLGSKRIILDDDNNIQNDAIIGTEDEPYFWPRPGLSNSNFIRGGDSISDLKGIMHWSFAGQSGTDAWRVRPVEEAFTYNFVSNNERLNTPNAVGGSLKVASFNVLNYFTSINSRGADSISELDRQREKIAVAICEMDADIVGLIEIENNGSVALQDLLNGLNGINANCGPYNYIATGVIGTDEIAVAFIYKSATVTAIGSAAILDSNIDPRFIDTSNRPALAQTFQESATGGVLTVVVNHLKSKGSACDDIGDPDVGDGQGNCNLTRKAAAEALVDWLATDPTGSGDPDFLIIGDLNSYRNEDPIDAIEAGADDTMGTADDYTDLLDAIIGPSAYTYVFDGQLGYLDYALASSSLFNQIVGTTAWQINADEIPVFDYNDDIRDGDNEQSFERESTALPIYEANAFRASDHDPVIVGMNVCDAIAPTIQVSLSPSVLWPPNHQYVRVEATVIVNDNFDQNPTVQLIGVSSSEPDDGLGDGDTANDIVIIDDFTFDLRAERSGTGKGRLYYVKYIVSDACGNSNYGYDTVIVPRSVRR